MVIYQVGLWKESDLSLRPEDVDFTGGTRIESRCRNQCQRCLEQLALEPSDLHLTKPPTYANFRTTWGVVVSALSMLGVVLVIICACYFLISFQVCKRCAYLNYSLLIVIVDRVNLVKYCTRIRIAVQNETLPHHGL